MATGRGAQVILTGEAQQAARGGAGATRQENIDAMIALIAAGLVADGNTVDGTSLTGEAAYDVVVAQFPDA